MSDPGSPVVPPAQGRDAQIEAEGGSGDPAEEARRCARPNRALDHHHAGGLKARSAGRSCTGDGPGFRFPRPGPKVPLGSCPPVLNRRSAEEASASAGRWRCPRRGPRARRSGFRIRRAQPFRARPFGPSVGVRRSSGPQLEPVAQLEIEVEVFVSGLAAGGDQKGQEHDSTDPERRACGHAVPPLTIHGAQPAAVEAGHPACPCPSKVSKCRQGSHGRVPSRDGHGGARSFRLQRRFRGAFDQGAPSSITRRARWRPRHHLAAGIAARPPRRRRAFRFRPV